MGRVIKHYCNDMQIRGTAITNRRFGRLSKKSITLVRIQNVSINL